MNVLEFKKIDVDNHERITFIRVEPINLKVTLKEIYIKLSNLSWINAFDEDFVKESFLARAEPTLKDIYRKIIEECEDEITSDAGEYVVSELAREAIIKELCYLDIPISELYSKQKSGNPGFDFHSQNECNVLIFGEAKYLQGKNAYGSGLSQVVDFIDVKKDIKDLNDLRDFVEPSVLANVAKGVKGFAIGFSAKTTKSEILIKNLISNKNYKNLRKYNEIILVAVNI